MSSISSSPDGRQNMSGKALAVVDPQRGAGLRFLWRMGEAAGSSAMAADGGREQGEMHRKGGDGSVTWRHITITRKWAIPQNSIIPDIGIAKELHHTETFCLDLEVL